MVFVCHVRRQVAKIDWVSPCKIGLALRHVFFGGGKKKQQIHEVDLWVGTWQHDTWYYNWRHSSRTSHDSNATNLHLHL